MLAQQTSITQFSGTYFLSQEMWGFLKHSGPFMAIFNLGQNRCHMQVLPLCLSACQKPKSSHRASFIIKKALCRKNTHFPLQSAKTHCPVWLRSDTSRSFRFRSIVRFFPPLGINFEGINHMLNLQVEGRGR